MAHDGRIPSPHELDLTNQKHKADGKRRSVPHPRSQCFESWNELFTVGFGEKIRAIFDIVTQHRKTLVVGLLRRTNGVQNQRRRFFRLRMLLRRKRRSPHSRRRYAFDNLLLSPGPMRRSGLADLRALGHVFLVLCQLLQASLYNALLLCRRQCTSAQSTAPLRFPVRRSRRAVKSCALSRSQERISANGAKHALRRKHVVAKVGRHGLLHEPSLVRQKLSLSPNAPQNQSHDIRV